MLEIGVTVPSCSQWWRPVVLVQKKDGGLQFCMDLSKLNTISAFDPYSIQQVDELVEQLGKAFYLTLCKGYWQVSLIE